MENKRIIEVDLSSGIAWAGFWIMLGLIYHGGGLRWLFGGS